jgi:hypothetical protein
VRSSAGYKPAMGQTITLPAECFDHATSKETTTSIVFNGRAIVMA